MTASQLYRCGVTVTARKLKKKLNVFIIQIFKSCFSSPLYLVLTDRTRYESVDLNSKI